jgi:hypothetical protein
MDLDLSITGITVAAFCVWLAVRIFNRREKWAILLAVYVMPTILALAWTRAFYLWSHR